jgi:hypothetical protein
VRRKDGRFATGVLHLWHRQNDRSQLPANRTRLDEVMSGARVRAVRGLSGLDADEAVPAQGTAMPQQVLAER